MNINDWQFLANSPLGRLLENNNQVFWVCSANLSQIVYVSPIYEKIFGRQITNLNEGINAFIQNIDTEEQKRINTALQSLIQGAVLNEEYRIVHPDNTIRWIYNRAYASLDASGNIQYIMGIAEDITERKQAETTLDKSSEQYCQLAENIGYVSWLITPDASQVLYISTNYEQVWGKSCASLYENPLSFIESIFPEDKPRVFAAIEQDSTQMDVEYRIIRPNGTICWIHARTYPIRAC